MSIESIPENLSKIREMAVAKALVDIVVNSEKGVSTLKDIKRFSEENRELFLRIGIAAESVEQVDPEGFSADSYMWGALYSYTMLGYELSIQNSAITQLPQINIEVLNTNTNDSLDVESNSQGINSLTEKLKEKILDGESPVDAMFSVVESEGITENIKALEASIENSETKKIDHLFEDFPTLRKYIDVIKNKYGEVASKSFLQGAAEVHGSFRTHYEIERISNLVEN